MYVYKEQAKMPPKSHKTSLLLALRVIQAVVYTPFKPLIHRKFWISSTRASVVQGKNNAGMLSA